MHCTMIKIIEVEVEVTNHAHNLCEISNFQIFEYIRLTRTDGRTVARTNQHARTVLVRDMVSTMMALEL